MVDAGCISVHVVHVVCMGGLWVSVRLLKLYALQGVYEWRRAASTGSVNT